MPAPTPTPLVAATPMAFARCITWAYAARGLCATDALAHAGISPRSVHDENGRITAAQFERLSAFAMRELDDEALGWFSRPLPWGSYGMLARASLSAPTLGLALRRWCRHHGLLTRDVTLHIETTEAEASIQIVDHCSLGVHHAFAHVSLLRNLLGLGSWLIDSRIPLRAVDFAYPPPPYADVYPILFPTSNGVQFGASHTRMRFDAGYLGLRLRRDEAAMNQMLGRALPLLVQHYRRDRLLVERVKTCLHTYPQDTQSAADVAQRLHLSVRTLHRQLHDAGTSLQTLKDQTRRDRALELLQRTPWPVKQVASAAGFRHEKSFMRAFRAWTGMTPTEYRAQAASAGR